MRGLMAMALVAALCGGPVLAQSEGLAQGEGLLPPGVPEKTLKRMRDAPDAFLIDAFDMILGYGTDGAIDAAGIDRFIAVDRAEARAKAAASLLAADLNADGAVGATEISVLVQAQAARQRGRLMQNFNAADNDGNGTVSGPEVAAAADTAAGDAVSPAKATALRSMMALDLDGDKLLTMDEVVKSVTLAEDAV